MMKPYRLAALAAVLLVGSVTSADAVTVNYTTSGMFGSTGMNSFITRNGVTITYNPITTGLDFPSFTQANFGSFTVTSTQASTSATFDSAANPTTDTFTLRINQTNPVPTGGNPAVFASTLTGTITYASNGLGQSNAFVDFTTLTQTINGNPPLTYQIVGADVLNPGRVNLVPNPVGATGSNVVSSAINGTITVSAVPEPGTMALACAALPLLGLGYVRNRRRNA